MLFFADTLAPALAGGDGWESLDERDAQKAPSSDAVGGEGDPSEEAPCARAPSVSASPFLHDSPEGKCGGSGGDAEGQGKEAAAELVCLRRQWRLIGEDVESVDAALSKAPPSVSCKTLRELTLHGSRLQSLEVRLLRTEAERPAALWARRVRQSLHGLPQGIERLEALERLCVSSNFLRSLRGVSALKNLRSLDVASNQLPSLEGLGGLVRLCELRAELNCIQSLAGLQAVSCFCEENLRRRGGVASGRRLRFGWSRLYAQLWGRDARLAHLDLRDNAVADVRELLFLGGLLFLKELRLQSDQSPSARQSSPASPLSQQERLLLTTPLTCVSVCVHEDAAARLALERRTLPRGDEEDAGRKGPDEKRHPPPPRVLEEGNAVCRNANYRRCVLLCAPNLERLDGLCVSKEEKREATCGDAALGGEGGAAAFRFHAATTSLPTTSTARGRQAHQEEALPPSETRRAAAAAGRSVRRQPARASRPPRRGKRSLAESPRLSEGDSRQCPLFLSSQERAAGESSQNASAAPRSLRRRRLSATAAAPPSRGPDAAEGEREAEAEAEAVLRLRGKRSGSLPRPLLLTATASAAEEKFSQQRRRGQPEDERRSRPDEERSRALLSSERSFAANPPPPSAEALKAQALVAAALRRLPEESLSSLQRMNALTLIEALARDSSPPVHDLDVQRGEASASVETAVESAYSAGAVCEGLSASSEIVDAEEPAALVVADAAEIACARPPEGPAETDAARCSLCKTENSHIANNPPSPPASNTEASTGQQALQVAQMALQLLQLQQQSQAQPPPSQSQEAQTEPQEGELQQDGALHLLLATPPSREDSPREATKALMRRRSSPEWGAAPVAAASRRNSGSLERRPLEKALLRAADVQTDETAEFLKALERRVEAQREEILQQTRRRQQLEERFTEAAREAQELRALLQSEQRRLEQQSEEHRCELSRCTAEAAAERERLRSELEEFQEKLNGLHAEAALQREELAAAQRQERLLRERHERALKNQHSQLQEDLAQERRRGKQRLQKLEEAFETSLAQAREASEARAADCEKQLQQRDARLQQLEELLAQQKRKNAQAKQVLAEAAEQEAKFEQHVRLVGDKLRRAVEETRQLERDKKELRAALTAAEAAQQQLQRDFQHQQLTLAKQKQELLDINVLWAPREQLREVRREKERLQQQLLSQQETLHSREALVETLKQQLQQLQEGGRSAEELQKLREAATKAETAQREAEARARDARHEHQLQARLLQQQEQQLQQQHLLLQQKEELLLQTAETNKRREREFERKLQRVEEEERQKRAQAEEDADAARAAAASASDELREAQSEVAKLRQETRHQQSQLRKKEAALEFAQRELQQLAEAVDEQQRRMRGAVAAETEARLEAQRRQHEELDRKRQQEVQTLQEQLQHQQKKTQRLERELAAAKSTIRERDMEMRVLLQHQQQEEASAAATVKQLHSLLRKLQHNYRNH